MDACKFPHCQGKETCMQYGKAPQLSTPISFLVSILPSFFLSANCLCLRQWFALVFHTSSQAQLQYIQNIWILQQSLHSRTQTQHQKWIFGHASWGLCLLSSAVHNIWSFDEILLPQQSFLLQPCSKLHREWSGNSQQDRCTHNNVCNSHITEVLPRESVLQNWLFFWTGLGW